MTHELKTRTDRPRTPLDRAISLALQLATLGLVILALIFIADSL